MESEKREVLILALSSGEHIICEVEDNAGVYFCINAMQIISRGDASLGKMEMGMIPYLPFADPAGGIAIPTNMASLAVPTEDLKAHYSRMFGLVFTPPTPKIILA